jgi:putative transposase
LTFSCFQNQPFFKGNWSKQWLVESIAAAKRKYSFDLWAWVIMPEHVHLLILPHDGVKTSAILFGIKKAVAEHAVNFVRKNVPEFIPRMLDVQPNGKKSLRFWQRGGGYDRNIMSIEELHEKIQYIHKNPVRRELVAEPDEWGWSSYRAWEYGEDEPLAIDRESLPPLNNIR